MSEAFGDARTIPASEEAKKIMKRLSNKGAFNEQRDVWSLGAAIGIKAGQIYETGNRETFQNLNSLDPDGIFGAVMVGLFPDLPGEQRLKKLVDFAEWGIREIDRRERNGTLDFSKMASQH